MAEFDKEESKEKLDKVEMDDLESEESENVITMVDVLEEEKELEDNAFAVLGASDEKNCTYLRGYVLRQALYSCNTCRKNDNEPAGICLACSYACHEGHELYELYTKRNFRCDCGNVKMLHNPCVLCTNKDSVNLKNQYNHNFLGKYCYCDRPFPDPENEDEMFQCIVCEDWFHGLHLNSSLPENDDFAEMICGKCMEKLNFLWFYYSNNSTINKNEDEKKTDEDAKKEEKVDNDNNEGDIETKSYDTSNIDSGIENSCDSLVSSSSNCKLKNWNSESIPFQKGATFWQQGWRSLLCKCSSCLKTYSLLEVDFIYDEKDTVQHYENQAKERSVQISQYERGLNEINKMDRVKSIEAIHECDVMTKELKDYLKKFADNKKVVRSEDIQEFFEGLKARKRQKVDLPYYCR